MPARHPPEAEGAQALFCYIADVLGAKTANKEFQTYLVNKKLLHGIEVVNSNATHNRVTIVGWPEGCIEYPGATQQINISYFYDRL